MTLQPARSSTTTRPNQWDQVGSRRRSIEAAAFVAVWMMAGYLLPIDSNGYLLLGIPLTVGFQVVVRRRPLRELYTPKAGRLMLDRPGRAIAGLLVVVPGWYAAMAGVAGDWTLFAWYVAAMAGAGCAAFSLRAASVTTALRSAALPLAAGSSVFALVYGAVHLATRTPVPVGAAVVALARYSFLYFPASFLLEEVAFRGALDAHVHRDGERGGWPSAVFVSALWGLWHLPVSTGVSLPVLVARLVAVHVLLGVPLSMAWRRSRNLTGPALAHAVNDAVRNALMLWL
jgi:membrane protease YdiL (CAAX protease family)